MKLPSSRIDLSNETRQEIATLLNQALADITDLYSQTKQAHWNVKGMEFYQLHELYDRLADMIFGYIDVIAERVTAIGAVAQGTTRMAAENSQLPEFAAGLGNGKEFTTMLAERYALVGESIRQSITKAMDAGDEDTGDLFIDVSRDLDKALWFLEAHLR
jgi:starvation-inducible DNA-binding protein